MTRFTAKSQLALICALMVVQPMFGAACSPWGYSTPSSSQLGSATAFGTSGNPGTGFYYYENLGGQTTSGAESQLAQAFYSLDMDGRTNGSGYGYFDSGKGAFSTSTYPSGTSSGLWVINSSYVSGGAADTVCQPGATAGSTAPCSACEAASSSTNDCTSQPFSKTPAMGLQSPTGSTGVKGFDFTGWIQGAASTGTGAGGAITAAAFFGESSFFLGGREFGFYSIYGSNDGSCSGGVSGPCDVMVYVANNANCNPDLYGGVICSTSQGGSGNITSSAANCDLSAALTTSSSGFTPGTTLTYGAWLVSESGTPYIYITASNGTNTYAYGLSASGYFSGTDFSSGNANLTGQTTLGLSRTDQNNSQWYQISPNNYPLFEVHTADIYQ
jgi:hypothetical protein